MAFPTCPRCSLSGSKFVKGEGDPNSYLWIIGEAPGAEEEQQGRPFVGRSGKILRDYCTKIGIDLSKVYITNAVHCRPPDNRTPTNEELVACQSVFKWELSVNVPKVILCLGRVPSSLFCDLKDKEPFSSVRGRIDTLTLLGNAVKIIYTWHPAYLLRNANNSAIYQEFESDLKLAKSLASGEFDEGLINLNCETISSLDRLKELVDKIITDNLSFAFDVETTGLVPYKDSVIGISICYNYNSGFYLPLLKRLEIFGQATAHLVSYWNDKQHEIVELLWKLLESDNIKAAHNASFDMKMLRASLSVRVRGKILDTKVLAHLFDENLQSFSLDHLQRLHFPYLPRHKESLRSYRIKEGIGFNYSEIPLEILADYCIRDSIVCYRLAKLFSTNFENSSKIKTFYFNHSLPLMRCLSDMELRGIYFDQSGAKELRQQLSSQKDLVEQEIFKKAGYKFNINSSPDVSTLLFDKLKLTPLKATKTGSSVDKETLKKLSEENEICKSILKYREYDKLISTYTLGESSGVPFDSEGIIHASFKQTGTVTGRLSCENPNLENLPVKAGGLIKKLYKPRGSDRVFIKGDYSQMELRVLAWYSKDEKLMEACATDIDLHKEVASNIFSISINDVTDRQRAVGKSTNFAIVYGQHFKQTAKMLGISDSEAEGFQRRYYEVFPGVQRFRYQTISLLKKQGFVDNCFGRCRRLPWVFSEDSALVSAAERQAVNSIIQGTSVDFCNYNMSRLHEFLESKFSDAYVILQVHDEIVVECYEKDSEEILEHFIHICEKPVLPLDVRMKVDAKIALSLAG